MEIWKDIVGFEGVYQVSNLGRVKSLERYKKNYSKLQLVEEKILKQTPSANKYLTVKLSKNGVAKTYFTHQEVAISFLNHKKGGKLIVDHINNDKQDNRLDNLQLITQRENTSKDKKGGSSKYTGVRKTKYSWRAEIKLRGKYTHIGNYKTELEAHLAYQKEIEKLNK